MGLRRTGRARTQRLSAVVHPTDSQNLSAFDSEISMRRLRLRLVRRMSFVERKSTAKVLHSPHTERAGPRWDSNRFRRNLTHNSMFSCISYHRQRLFILLFKPSINLRTSYLDLLCVEKFLMLDQIHDSHYYCRENRMAKHPSATASTNAPSKASIVVQKELQKIKSSLPDVRFDIC